MSTIGRADLTYLGCLKPPTGVDFGPDGDWATSYSDGTLAVRRVGGELRFFSTVHVYSGGLIYEFDFPGLGPDIASAPTASVVKAWGNVYGNYRPYAGGSGGNRTWGLFWFPGDAHLPEGIMWAFGSYYLGLTDWPSIGLTGITGDTATPYGNWKTATYGRGYREAGAVVMPDGRLGIAGGGAARTNTGMSLGPAMFAVTTADMAAATPTTVDGGGNITYGSNVPYTTLILYDQNVISAHAPPYTTPEPFHRDNGYRPAWYGLLDQTAPSASLVPLPSSDVYAIDDHYNGHSFICRGETRTIIDFDGPTRTATLDSPLSFVPQIGDGYEVSVIASAAEVSLYMWIAQGSVGYMSQIDRVGQPVWIEGGDKKAVIFPLTLLKGRAYYRPGGINVEARKHILAIFDPADLDGSDGIEATELIDLADYGLQSAVAQETREEVSLAWDAVGSLLFLIENGAWTNGYEWFPVVHAWHVNLGSAGGGRPALTGRLTRLTPCGYGGRRHGSFVRVLPTAVLLTVTDLANGGGFLATISGCDSTSVNTLYSTRWSGAVGGSAWTVAGIRTGSGDIGGTLPVGSYWWYVLSVFGSATVVSSLVYQPLTDGAAALHDRILEAVTAKIQSLAIVGLAGVYLHKFPSVAKSDGPGLVVTYFGEAEEMMGGDRAADEIGFPVLIYQDAPTLVEEETRPRELLWRAQISEALSGQRLAGVPEVTTCVVEPRSVLEQGSEMLTRNPQDVANRMRSGMLFRFVARVARG